MVTLSPPTSEAGIRSPAWPQVGKLVVACRWSAVYSTEPYGSVVSTDFSLMLLGSYLCELTYVAIDCEFGIWLIVEVLLYFSYVGPSIWTCELLMWVTWPPLVHS